MTTATNIQENAEDILAEAKDIVSRKLRIAISLKSMTNLLD